MLGLICVSFQSCYPCSYDSSPYRVLALYLFRDLCRNFTFRKSLVTTRTTSLDPIPGRNQRCCFQEEGNTIWHTRFTLFHTTNSRGSFPSRHYDAQQNHSLSATFPPHRARRGNGRLRAHRAFNFGLAILVTCQSGSPTFATCNIGLTVPHWSWQCYSAQPSGNLTSNSAQLCSGSSEQPTSWYNVVSPLCTLHRRPRWWSPHPLFPKYMASQPFDTTAHCRGDWRLQNCRIHAFPRRPHWTMVLPAQS